MSLVFTQSIGLVKQIDDIIEIAASAPLTGRTFSTLVRLPEGKTIPTKIEKLTTITTAQVQNPNLPSFPEAYSSFLQFIESEVQAVGPGALPLLIGHNAFSFDLPMLCISANRYNMPIPRDARILDTLAAARQLFTGALKPEKGFRLGDFYTHLTNKNPENAHRADADVAMTVDILHALVQRSGCTVLSEFFGRPRLPSAFDSGWVGKLSLKFDVDEKDSNTKGSTVTSGEFGGKNSSWSKQSPVSDIRTRGVLTPPINTETTGLVDRIRSTMGLNSELGSEIDATGPSNGFAIASPESRNLLSSLSDEFSVESWAADDPLAAIETYSSGGSGAAAGRFPTDGATSLYSTAGDNNNNFPLEPTYNVLAEAHASWQALTLDPSISDTFLNKSVDTMRSSKSSLKFTSKEIELLYSAGLTRLLDVLECFPRGYTACKAGQLPDRSLREEDQPVNLAVALEEIDVSFKGWAVLNAVFRVLSPEEIGFVGPAAEALAQEHDGRHAKLIYTIIRPPGRNANWIMRKEEEKLRSMASVFAIAGKVTPPPYPRWGQDAWQFKEGSVQFMDIENFKTVLEAGESHIQVIYPSKAGILPPKLASMTQKALGMLRAAPEKWEDPIPVGIRQHYQLPGYLDALSSMHAPESPEQYEIARQRLAFQELLILQLKLLLQRASLRLPASEAGRQGVRITDLSLVNVVRQALPYELTGAQDRALGSILASMAGWPPMMTLLQGDVGCGKTIVAFLSVLAAAGSGYQAAVMAPTEILAEQHFAVLNRLIEEARNLAEEEDYSDDGTAGSMAVLPEVAFLTGSTKRAERNRIYAGLEDGSIKVVVGTHALISDPVTFSNLGFAVIDEQHKFGVGQRAALLNKACPSPHILSMSATPIPRSLALVAHGELSLVIIDELPPGRLPVQTKVVMDESSSRAEVYDHMRREVAARGQVYIVCPLVEEKEKDNTNSNGSSMMGSLNSTSGSTSDDESTSSSTGIRQLKAAVQERDRLVAEGEISSELCGVLHGRMSSEEKEAALTAFASGRTPVLISTTVVEVGVDVPAASLIIVEHADRFGLAQLHQLRGRVGRGGRASACYLITDKTGDEQERLKVLESKSSGFDVAEADFVIRGAGDVIGRRQSGREALGALKACSLPQDGQLVIAAREAAAALMAATGGKPTGWPKELVAAVVDPKLVDLDLAEIPNLG